MPKRKNLWFTLLFVFLGALMLRLAFFITRQSLAIPVLLLGAVLIIAGLIIFWKNFRE